MEAGGIGSSSPVSAGSQGKKLDFRLNSFRLVLPLIFLLSAPNEEGKV